MKQLRLTGSDWMPKRRAVFIRLVGLLPLLALISFAAIGVHKILSQSAMLPHERAVKAAEDRDATIHQRRQAMHRLYRSLLEADAALRRIEAADGPSEIRSEAGTILDQFHIRLERRDRDRVPFKNEANRPEEKK